jgi:hypothetical protein
MNEDEARPHQSSVPARAILARSRHSGTCPATSRWARPLTAAATRDGVVKAGRCRAVRSAPSAATVPQAGDLPQGEVSLRRERTVPKHLCCPA